MAKKRKSTPQAATLHDFFGKAGRAPPKKVKIEPDTTRTPLKCVDSGDIIIIDSDDDELPKASSKVTLLDDGEDVPIEETSFGLPLLLTQEDGSAGKDSPSAFGAPSLLVASAEEATVSHTSVKTGPAAPLNGCTPPPIAKTPSGDAPLHVLEDEWGTGDDEAELDALGRSMEAQEEDAVDIDLTLDEDAVDIDLTLDDSDALSQSTEHVRTCPLCDKRLVNMSDVVRMDFARGYSCY